MKNFILLVSLLVFPAVLISCNNKSEEKKIAPETYSQYINKGADISTEAQAALLSNVSRAMQKGGPEYAVEFCNLQASSIVDSLNQLYNTEIGRVSAKNRNPQNDLKNDTEKELWNIMAKKIKAGKAHDTLLVMNDNLVYYKPIKTAMPACLNCHGTAGENINPATFEKIQTLYPEDKATGYDLNEFRGLWKIRFLETEI
ncbi:MAG: c-type heme family protein [Prolixibacteraceae bacterium]